MSKVINTHTGEVLESKQILGLKENALLKKNVETWRYWDFNKNNLLGYNIFNVTYGQATTVWWICEKGHSFSNRVNRMSDGFKCSICSNKKVLKGFNDVWTTNPSLASLLLNPEDGYGYMQNSTVKVDWKCPKCNSTILKRSFDHIKRIGLSCSHCSDGISYGEKVISNLLKQLDISFLFDEKRHWSDDRRYDFYLPTYKAIIEVHGMQHYDKGFSSLGSRSLIDEKTNDELKRNLAIKNNIEFYIELDCSNSELSWIRDSILNSELKNMFNLNEVNWVEVGLKSTMSNVVESCKLYESGKPIYEISKILNVDRNTITTYLNRGFEIGLTTYTSSKIKKEVVQLTINNELVEVWESQADASKALNMSESAVSSCCNGRQKTAKGYKWMYRDKYEECLKSNSFKEDSYGGWVPVVRIGKDGDKVYKSIQEAKEDLNLKSYAHISNCCRGKRKTAYGFRWMYLEDYKKVN